MYLLLEDGRTIGTKSYTGTQIHEEGLVQVECDECCGKAYVKKFDYVIVKTACSWQCGKQLNMFKLAYSSRVCPECGGKARGKGYRHLKHCSKYKQERGPCPECHAQPSGRGYKHEKTCSNHPYNVALEKKRQQRRELAAKGEIPTCPECGGLPARRGFFHASNCSKRTVRKERSPCPECGGEPCKGGYRHTDICCNNPKNKRYNVQRKLKLISNGVIERCKECGGLPKGRGFAHTDWCSLRTGRKSGAE